MRFLNDSKSVQEVRHSRPFVLLSVSKHSRHRWSLHRHVVAPASRRRSHGKGRIRQHHQMQTLSAYSSYQQSLEQDIRSFFASKQPGKAGGQAQDNGEDRKYPSKTVLTCISMFDNLRLHRSKDGHSRTQGELVHQQEQFLQPSICGHLRSSMVQITLIKQWISSSRC